jgi:hypothetical protein
MLVASLIVYLLMRAQQTATSVENGRDFIRKTPYESWVLDYTCDSGQEGRCEEPRPGWKQFDSYQEAIDWINANWQYAPGPLQHEGTFLRCSFTYLYPDAAPDSDQQWFKSTDCATQDYTPVSD